MSDSKARILVIDSGHSDFVLFRRYLDYSAMPANCLCISNAKELDGALNEQWDLAAVGTDVQGMDFLSTVETIQRTQPKLPVIALAASRSDAENSAIMHCKLSGVLFKQELSHFSHTVQQALRQEEKKRARALTYPGVGNEQADAIEQQHQASLAALNMMEDAVAARRRAEEAYASLRESEERHRIVLENAADAVFVANTDARYIYVNQKASDLLGYTTDEMLKMAIPDIAPADQAERSMEIFHRLQNEGHLLEELDLLHSSGKRIPVELNAVMLPDGNLYGACRDISERKQAEAYMQQAAAVYESSRDAIMVTDSDANVIAVNPAFVDITGYLDSEIIGKPPNILRSDYHDRSFYQQIWASINKHDGWSGEIWNRRKDGNIYPAWLSVSVIRDNSNRVINYIGILSDLSRLKRSEEELEHLSTHDPLTDLPNGRLLESRLEHAIAQARRHKSGLAVLMLDIDRFKDINDSLGLSTGDALLMELARRVTGTLWEGDTVARIGGDELLILIEDIRSPQQAATVAEKIRSIQNAPFRIDGQEFFITISMGISLYPENGDTPELLIRNADAAVYRAKEEGRNRIAFYSESLSRAAAERISMEAELRYALEGNQLELHFQPQLNLSSCRLTGVEALIRWRHPQRGLIPPDSFIPVAESTGLIEDIGEWVLREGCRQMREWLDSGVDVPRISINLSAKQLGRGDLVAAVQTTLDEYRLSPGMIELELTETAIMQDPERAAATLRAMADMGIEMAVDDFGTGYSSLAYLQRLHMHRLKIDRAFVNGLPDDKNNAAICRAVIALANSLGMETIAEGVEEQQQADYLDAENCTIGQGWLYARAMPAAELIAWIQQRETSR